MKRTLAWVVGAVVAVNVALLVIEYVLPSPSGRRSSSLATAPAGFAAWAELARRSGVEVVSLRAELREAQLPPGGTIVALDVPGLPRADARVLRQYDGRVVVGGIDPDRWLDVFDPDLTWSSTGPTSVSFADLSLQGEGAGSFGGEFAAERGNALLLADATPLQNARLARADNAAFALELAGEGPLIFAEAPHGYEESSGLGALPTEGKWALGLLGVAALLLMLARGRRFGPPELDARPLEPPRVAYVDALAAALAKTRDPAGAMEPIRAAFGEAAPPRDDEAALALARRHAARFGAAPAAAAAGAPPPEAGAP